MPVIAPVVIAITSGTQWRVPADCTSATIECIGGGSVGGGAYSKTNTVTLTPLSLAYINVGSGSETEAAGDTWFNKSVYSPPSSTTNGARAKGGNGLPPVTAGVATGGQASSGVGDVKYSGGSGYGYYTEACCNTFTFGYSFGGAAGPNGAGGDGLLTGSYGGGGGANGGESATGTTGGNNRLGSGGGAAGNPPSAGSNGGGGGARTGGSGNGGAGSADLVFTDYLGNTYGPAGGGGGAINLDSTVSGALYGGGGGQGGQGLIIVTYTPVVTIGASYTEVLNTYGPTNEFTPSRWRIPYGVDSVTIHAIGEGGSGTSSGVLTGGGGGAYASATIDVSTLNNTGAYYSLPYNRSSFTPYDAWFNKAASSAPSSSTNGVRAKAAGVDSATGGSAASSVGTVKYSGGNGGMGAGTSTRKSAGGGGAAGPSGDGKNGGNAFSTTGSGSSGGGGGANGGSSTAGESASSATVAGAGGAGNGGSGGGAAATATTYAGAGTNGGGGGGGKNSSTPISGGNGGTQYIWTDSGTGTQYGPGGGGGGLAAINSFTYGNAGSGANWGGGSGGSVGFPSKGDSLIVLQYTITKSAGGGNTSNMLMFFQ